MGWAEAIVTAIGFGTIVYLWAQRRENKSKKVRATILVMKSIYGSQDEEVKKDLYEVLEYLTGEKHADRPTVENK